MAEWVDWRGEPQPPAFVLKRECDTFNADVRALTFVRSFVYYSCAVMLRGLVVSGEVLTSKVRAQPSMVDPAAKLAVEFREELAQEALACAPDMGGRRVFIPPYRCARRVVGKTGHLAGCVLQDPPLPPGALSTRRRSTSPLLAAPSLPAHLICTDQHAGAGGSDGRRLI